MSRVLLKAFDNMMKRDGWERGRAIRAAQVVTFMNAFASLAIQGTPMPEDDDPNLFVKRYQAPWYLVDTAKAELEVNYPGELISVHEEHENAQVALFYECFRRTFGHTTEPAAP